MSTIYSDDSRDTLKMIRETLVVAQTLIGNYCSAKERKSIHVDRLNRLIKSIDEQRPLGPDGKHGNRHTPTCGCEDT